MQASADVAQATVSSLERSEELKSETTAAIRAALEAAGVGFIIENCHGAGVELEEITVRLFFLVN